MDQSVLPPVVLIFLTQLTHFSSSFFLSDFIHFYIEYLENDIKTHSSYKVIPYFRAFGVGMVVGGVMRVGFTG